MNKETLLVVVVSVIATVIIGWMVWQKSSAPAPAKVSGPIVQQPATSAADQQKINELRSLVAANPANRQAWVTLGHLYFDTDQPANSVEAYQRALELNGADPDVLTDQGVMYRRLGRYEQAIDNFARANQINPQHATSLYNMGIVYRYDLMNFAKAEEAWNRYLQISPGGPGADQVRQQLNALKMRPPQ